MYKLIGPQTEITFHRLSTSYPPKREISENLNLSGINVNSLSVYNIIKRRGKRRECALKGVLFKPKLKKKKLTEAVLKSIDMLSHEKHPSQKFMDSKLVYQ